MIATRSPAGVSRHDARPRPRGTPAPRTLARSQTSVPAPHARREPDVLDALLQRAVAGRGRGPVLARGKLKSTTKSRKKLNDPTARQVTPTKVGKQRFIHVGGRKYSRTAPNAKLFDEGVVPVLEYLGRRSHGSKSLMRLFIQTHHGSRYATMDAFSWAYYDFLVDRDTDFAEPLPLRMRLGGRPAWPKALKTRKGVRKGDHLRHVVRNATLRNALLTEFGKLSEDEHSERAQQLVTQLKIATPKAKTTSDRLSEIYKQVYLNPENLFSGEGEFNVVIGFAADPVRLYGEELVKGGLTPVTLAEVYKTIMGHVETAARKAKARGDHRLVDQAVEFIRKTVAEAVKSLAPNATDVASAVAGQLAVNIGLNFGFDLIEGRVDEDRKGISGRQARLVWSETSLDTFTRTEGKEGDLGQIFGVFLGDSIPKTL